MSLDIADRDRFVRANTALLPAPLVPEIELHLATEALPLWQMTEEAMAEAGLPPPYWAFAWAGGQALARYVLDNPEIVAGRRVIDFAAGSGLVAIAAAMAGASMIAANDIDPFSHVAMRLNARANGVAIDVLETDIVGEPLAGFDLVLAADICYEQPTSGRVETWFRQLSAGGMPVLMGDPGRSFRPKSGLEKLAHYAVPTTRELEDNDVRSTDVWRFVQ
ncbi:class I SAM-dependent methyltransferase [Minwuia thermotolerans]|uniref:Nicotinamide N-methylase n=1 Tax=Minwuia thermotolerans TaxID=2056226 RepID=A0A2M9G6X7_9PROT|nr:methyltransferase [Minwuia thermotolerans]PJK31479.1 nicotinamide N-methylase [Minwuia thermotolerans]